MSYILYEQNILPIDPSGTGISLALVFPTHGQQRHLSALFNTLFLERQMVSSWIRHLDLLRMLVIDLDQDWIGSS